MYDILIRNGILVDGTGAPCRKGDIAIKDGKIVAIGENLPGEAARVIDAAGKVVSPGFIDFHNHSDAGILLGLDAHNYLEQGVTTQVTGLCGTGAAPCYPGMVDENKVGLSQEECRKWDAICDSIPSFLNHVSQMELGTNMAFFIPQGNIRGRVMGFDPSVPTEEQLEEMKTLVREAMEAGCIGFTTGLVYAPSVYAGEDELVELAKAVGEYGGCYDSHIRGEGANVVEAVEEAIRVGEKAGIPVVISHVKVIGTENEGLSQEIIRVMEEANARGVKVRADQYPYLAGSAPFISCIPPKFHVDGDDKLTESLKDPKVRQAITHSVLHEREEFESHWVSAGFEGCLMVGCAKTPQYIGKTIAQIAKEEGKDPFDASYDLLIANDGVAQGIYFCQNESDMLRLLAHPYVMGGSDWSNFTVRHDPEQVGGAHPRGYSTFINRLALIRDHGLMTLEESIHRITGLPAEMSGIEGIGVLQEGARGDICIFDYNELCAQNDYVHPFRPNLGLDYVLVSGKPAVEQGRYTGVKNGRVLRRSR